MKYFYLSLLIVSTFIELNAQQKTEAIPLKAALVQATPVWGDVEKNLESYAKRINDCKDCDLIILPEFFTTGAQMSKKDREEAIKEKEQVASYYPQIVETMKAWAAQAQALVMGSTIYAEDGKLYNRLVAAFPDGSVKHYDKHNTFKKGIYTPGNEQLILSYKGYKIATYICYDLRFSEWSRNTAGYDIAVYIANWPESRHQDWEVLLRERAIENRAAVIGVNCTGEDPSGLKYAGESMAVNSKGELIKKAGSFVEQVLIVELNK